MLSDSHRNHVYASEQYVPVWKSNKEHLCILKHILPCLFGYSHNCTLVWTVYQSTKKKAAKEQKRETKDTPL